jgi:4-hydroxybenzoate polyprenyltransferase
LLTYLAGAVSTGVLPTADAFAMIALLSVWMGVGGTSKDLADIAGDRLAGRRTLPVRLGARSAARLVGIGCLAVSVCGCGLAASGSRHWLPALVLSGGALIAALQLQQSSPTGDRARARSPYRTFMCVQYLANASFLVSCTLGSAL